MRKSTKELCFLVIQKSTGLYISEEWKRDRDNNSLLKSFLTSDPANIRIFRRKCDAERCMRDYADDRKQYSIYEGNIGKNLYISIDDLEVVHVYPPGENSK